MFQQPTHSNQQRKLKKYKGDSDFNFVKKSRTSKVFFEKIEFQENTGSRDKMNPNRSGEVISCKADP